MNAQKAKGKTGKSVAAKPVGKGNVKPAGKVATSSTAPKQSEQPKAKDAGSGILEGIKCGLRDIDKILVKDEGNVIKQSGRWPLLIDPNGQATTFLRYRDSNYLCTANSNNMQAEAVRMALIGSIRFGKPMLIDMLDTDMLVFVEKVLNEIQPNLFNDLMSKEILKEEKYLQLVRPEDGDIYSALYHHDFRVDDFVFVIVSGKESPPENLMKLLFPVRVE